MATVQKLSISLPPQLAAFVYQYHEQTKETVSKIISDALQCYQDRLLMTACIEYAADEAEQYENQLWDNTVGDGIR